jgi:hypothetical protein
MNDHCIDDALHITDIMMCAALPAACPPHSVSALTVVVRMYAAELHTKCAILAAIEALIHGTPHRSEGVDSSASSSARRRLLHARGGTHAHSAAIGVARTSLLPLEVYLSSWLLEPQISVATLASTANLWMTQVPVAKGARS